MRCHLCGAAAGYVLTLAPLGRRRGRPRSTMQTLDVVLCETCARRWWASLLERRQV